MQGMCWYCSLCAAAAPERHAVCDARAVKMLSVSHGSLAPFCRAVAAAVAAQTWRAQMHGPVVCSRVLLAASVGPTNQGIGSC